jgi:hypothetical protein
MPKKLTPEEKERRAIEAGFDPDKSQLSSQRVLRDLEPKTQEDYSGVWNS